MKRIGLAILTLGLLVCGFVSADSGVPQVNEVQGLSIETTVIAVGNFDQESSVYISSSAGQSLNDMPPLNNGVVYESVYTEDTQSSGIGYISYDKSFHVDTSNKVSGQYNIESTRQITYLGIEAGSIYSSEYLMMGGSGTSQSAGGRIICPFAGEDATIAAFCNRVESGSTFSMSVANVLTQANTRFITKSADSPVELNYNIEVNEYSPGVPSKGSVAAYIKGKINEGGRGSSASFTEENPDDLYGTGEFLDRTEIIGDISLFSKQMHYESYWSG